MSKSSVDSEVGRLLAQAANPRLRLPRSVPELNMALLESRGSRMNREALKAFRIASELGPATRLDFEDVLLAGGTMDEINIVLEIAAEKVSQDLIERHGEEVGGEVARLLENRGR